MFLRCLLLEWISPGNLDLPTEAFEVVDHRLKLFLDVDVFEEEEELSCFLKVSNCCAHMQVTRLQAERPFYRQTSLVRFGEPEEFPSLVVVSDKRIYVLEVTSGSG